MRFRCIVDEKRGRSYAYRAHTRNLRGDSHHAIPYDVTGAIQVGKTTILRHLSGLARTYVTLDEPLLLNLAKTEPALFLLKSYWHNGRRAPFYFFRDKDQKEVDLVIVQDGMVYPLEIKKTAAPGKDGIRHFGTLERLGLPVGPGGVISLVEQALPMTAMVQAIPVWAL